MINNWIEPEDVSIPKCILDAVGGHFLVSKTLYQLNIQFPDQALAFLDPDFYTPTSALELPGIKKAARRLDKAIDRGEKILVWGDFDVDGQTSTTLLVESLRELGAKLTYHIPVRVTEGHGIKVEVLEGILQKVQHTIKILLTCDTGIAEHKAIKFAQVKGLDVIVTDHHDLPVILPPAYAVINPKLLSADHPLANLPGVGVAYKLIEALYEVRNKKKTDNNGQINQSLSTEKYLDLVALGIVADVAELRKDTRYLLQKGLTILRNSKRQGIKMLIDSAEIIPNQLDEGHVGFSIGPRLNALGRLSDANPIVEFLISEDSEKVRDFAIQLEKLNEQRKFLTDQITQAVLEMLDRKRVANNKTGLVITGHGWHTGIIGIVASRLVDRFGKPTIIFSVDEEGIARGSARSIEGVNISEAIATKAELLIAFGGHPTAAGLTLHEKDIPKFQKGFEIAIKDQLENNIPEPNIRISSFLSWEDLSLDLAEDIDRLAPFGVGNPRPIFASFNLSLVRYSKIGPRKEHLKMMVTDDSGTNHDVYWWFGVGNPIPEPGIPIDLAYTLHTNKFRGERQLQLQLVGFRITEKSDLDINVETQHINIIDHRNTKNPVDCLNTIKAEHDVQVWIEGEEKSEVIGLHRNKLVYGKTLVVWTAPSNPTVWNFIKKSVNPKKIFLIATNPDLDNPRFFLARLTGLVKFALTTKDGTIKLVDLECKTGQPEQTIITGLAWLVAKGLIQVAILEKNIIRITPGNGAETANSFNIGEHLQSLLAESRAYRKYFQTTALDNLT